MNDNHREILDNISDKDENNKKSDEMKDVEKDIDTGDDKITTDNGGELKTKRKSQSTEVSEDNKDEEETSFLRELCSWVMIFAGAFIVAYILSNFVIVNAKVPTGSMISTININDKVMGFRLSYKFSDPKRGDIVMFNAPDKENTIYIKRIIGLPGDKIVIEDNKVYINGKELKENYIKNGWTRNEGITEYEVPEGEYFMMGDNRDQSSDSRVWGTVKKDAIIAKAIFKYKLSLKDISFKKLN